MWEWGYYFSHLATLRITTVFHIIITCMRASVVENLIIKSRKVIPVFCGLYALLRTFQYPFVWEPMCRIIKDNQLSFCTFKDCLAYPHGRCVIKSWHIFNHVKILQTSIVVAVLPESIYYHHLVITYILLTRIPKISSKQIPATKNKIKAGIE